jgi:hypothetical protein
MIVGWGLEFKNWLGVISVKAKDLLAKEPIRFVYCEVSNKLNCQLVACGMNILMNYCIAVIFFGIMK